MLILMLILILYMYIYMYRNNIYIYIYVYTYTHMIGIIILLMPILMLATRAIKESRPGKFILGLAPNTRERMSRSEAKAI